MENKTQDYMQNAMKALKSRGTSKKNAVEDKFFNLDEMEKFLDAEDAKAMKNSSKQIEEDPNEIDYFGSDFDETNSENSESEVKNLMYKDFFDPVEASSNGEIQNQEPSFHEISQDTTKDLLQSDSEPESNDDLGEIKSTHELRTMRLQKKIKAMEEESVNTKPWQMTGKQRLAIFDKFRQISFKRQIL